MNSHSIKLTFIHLKKSLQFLHNNVKKNVNDNRQILLLKSTLPLFYLFEQKNKHKRTDIYSFGVFMNLFQIVYLTLTPRHRI